MDKLFPLLQCNPTAKQIKRDKWKAGLEMIDDHTYMYRMWCLLKLNRISSLPSNRFINETDRSNFGAKGVKVVSHGLIIAIV